jgi:hypothetical protein
MVGLSHEQGLACKAALPRLPVWGATISGGGSSVSDVTSLNLVKRVFYIVS